MLINQRPILEQIVQRLSNGTMLIHAEPLKGGASAQVILLDVQHTDGSKQHYLLRVHSEQDRSRNADVAQHEFTLLKELHRAGLPVPEPFTLDVSGEIYPIPYVVLEYLDGATVFNPHDLSEFIRQSAYMLAKIHRLPLDEHTALKLLGDRAAHALGWIQYQPEQLDESLDEGRLRDHLRNVFPLQQVNAPALLHGDFWAGNLIWREGKLVGVIDWEDAEIGDPLSDLSIARLEMLWAFGQDAMVEVTQKYRESMPDLDYGNLPQWDLFAALRPAGQLSAWVTTWAGNGRPDVTYETLREGHQWFVKQAFEQLVG